MNPLDPLYQQARQARASAPSPALAPASGAAFISNACENHLTRDARRRDPLLMAMHRELRDKDDATRINAISSANLDAITTHAHHSANIGQEIYGDAIIAMLAEAAGAYGAAHTNGNGPVLLEDKDPDGPDSRKLLLAANHSLAALQLQTVSHAIDQQGEKLYVAKQLLDKGVPEAAHETINELVREMAEQLIDAQTLAPESSRLQRREAIQPKSIKPGSTDLKRQPRSLSLAGGSDDN